MRYAVLQTIIEETLERICSQCSYRGKMDVHVPYNTPYALPIENELAKRTELHGYALRCERVIGSTSKAHNLEYALKVPGHTGLMHMHIAVPLALSMPYLRPRVERSVCVFSS